MAVKPIIIPLVADTSGLTIGIEALEQLGTVDSKTAADFKAANKAFADRGKVIDQSTNSTEKLAAASKKLVESIAGGAISQATANIEKLAKEAEEAGKDFVVLDKTIGQAKAQLESFGKNTPEFNKLSKEIQAAEMSIGNFTKQATSSRAQLKQYREALLQLEEAGLDDTNVFNEMAVAAGQLEDQIGDTQARIKALASDTFELDAGIQTIQGIAGAFAIAEGAAALFGDENEDLQQALLRVNAAMSILNGLQQLQNILQKQSTANIFIENALRRISAASTTLQSLAESRYTVVRVLATGAQNALNAAMSANPAGILLLAITAAAGALLLFSNNSDKAADSQEDLAAATKKVIEALNEEIGLQERLRNTRTGGLTQLRQEIAELQARGGARSKIAALESRALDEEIQNAQIRKQTFSGVAGAEKEFDDAAADIVRLRAERRVKDLESQKAAADEGTAATKKSLEDQKKATQAFLRDQVAANEAAVIESQAGFSKLVAQISLINAKLRQELANPELGPNERLAAELRAGEDIKKAREGLLGDLEKVGLKDIDIFKKAQKEEVLESAKASQQKLEGRQNEANVKVRIAEEEAEREKKARKDLIESVISTSVTIANTLAQTAIDITRGRAEAEQAILEDQLNNGLISQKEYDNQVRIIKRKQAQDEKKLAVFTAIIGTAAAVVKALPNIALSVIAGVLGAAQIAAIVARPIPQFKHGTKNAPGGLSLVGEAGGEIIHHKGRWRYASSATLLDLPRGAQVIPATETAKILQKWDIPTPNIQQNYSTSTSQQGIDYKKLAHVIGIEIGKLPLNVFGFDKDGPFQFTARMQDRLNNKRSRYGR